MIAMFGNRLDIYSWSARLKNLTKRTQTTWYVIIGTASKDKKTRTLSAREFVETEKLFLRQRRKEKQCNKNIYYKSIIWLRILNS